MEYIPIDHILPVAAGGKTIAENLALACVSCSLRKSARQFVVDPQSGQTVPIYHLRQQTWSEHFQWEGVRIVGLTESGRATVRKSCSVATHHLKSNELTLRIFGKTIPEYKAHSGIVLPKIRNVGDEVPQKI